MEDTQANFPAVAARMIDAAISPGEPSPIEKAPADEPTACAVCNAPGETRIDSDGFTRLYVGGQLHDCQHSTTAAPTTATTATTETTETTETATEPKKAINKAQTVKKAISRKKHVFQLISSPTGVGKTEEIAKTMKKDLEAGSDADDKKRPISSSLTDNKTNIRNLKNHLIKLGVSKNDIAVQIGRDAKDSTDTENIDPESTTEPTKPINLGHYHWLGFKGELTETYAVAGHEYLDKDFNKKIRHGLTTAKNLYLDEFHAIWDICAVSVPLCCAYVPKMSRKITWLIPTERFQGVKMDTFLHWPDAGIGSDTNITKSKRPCDQRTRPQKS